MSYKAERRKKQTATIAISGTISNAINCLGKSLTGLIMPSAFTGANITIKSSFDGTTYKDAYNSAGNLLTIAIGIDRHIHLTPVDFFGAKFFKLVSDQTEIAERVIGVILMGV